MPMLPLGASTMTESAVGFPKSSNFAIVPGVEADADPKVTSDTANSTNTGNSRKESRFIVSPLLMGLLLSGLSGRTPAPMQQDRKRTEKRANANAMGNGRSSDGDSKVLGSQHWGQRLEGERALDHVAQLAHVPWPAVRAQRREGVGCEDGWFVP